MARCSRRTNRSAPRLSSARAPRTASRRNWAGSNCSTGSPAPSGSARTCRASFKWSFGRWKSISRSISAAFASATTAPTCSISRGSGCTAENSPSNWPCPKTRASRSARTVSRGVSWDSSFSSRTSPIRPFLFSSGSCAPGSIPWWRRRFWSRARSSASSFARGASRTISAAANASFCGS